MLSYTSAEGSSSDIFVGRDSTSYRLVGLRPGVLHTVYIWAFSGDKVSGKSSTEAETVGSDTSYVLTDPRPGVVYPVNVWVVSGSKASRKISTQAETELDAPANLIARDETESSFSLSWDPVQAEIDGYILTYTVPDGSTKEITVGPDRTSYMLTGLQPAVLYTVYIKAVRGDKTSRTISTQAETGVTYQILVNLFSS
ncbi:hypothetical protein GOODEAATRI_013966 [Goodea atripinnis]|uniref:Fibronectin type-III domain-containing protein n=1 Tax=Goodea atripinnis TaxID=208336 RepID=A0ABV0NCS9_9TELE